MGEAGCPGRWLFGQRGRGVLQGCWGMSPSARQGQGFVLPPGKNSLLQLDGETEKHAQPRVVMKERALSWEKYPGAWESHQLCEMRQALRVWVTVWTTGRMHLQRLAFPPGAQLEEKGIQRQNPSLPEVVLVTDPPYHWPMTEVEGRGLDQAAMRSLLAMMSGAVWRA